MRSFAPHLTPEQLLLACVPDLLASSLHGRSASPTSGPQVDDRGLQSGKDPSLASPVRQLSSSSTQEAAWSAWCTALRMGEPLQRAASQALEAGVHQVSAHLSAPCASPPAPLLLVVEHWEQEARAWVSSPGMHTIGLFDPTARAFTPGSTLHQLLTSFPHVLRHTQALCTLPLPVASWVLSARTRLGLEALLAHRSPHCSESLSVLETALGLWDPAGPAPASSLATALQTAQLLS